MAAQLYQLCVALAVSAAVFTTADAVLQCVEGVNGVCPADKFCYKFQADQEGKKVAAKRGCGDLFCKLIKEGCHDYTLPVVGTKGSMCCCSDGDKCNGAMSRMINGWTMWLAAFTVGAVALMHTQ